AALIYNQSAPLRMNVVLTVAAGCVVGGYLGAKLVPHVPEAYLRLAFGGLLLYLGLLFVLDLPPAHPAGLVLAPLTAIVGWVARRFRRKPAPPEQPTDRNEYYI